MGYSLWSGKELDMTEQLSRSWLREGLLLGCRLSLFPPMGEGSKESLWSPFYKGTNPILEGRTLMT